MILYILGIALIASTIWPAMQFKSKIQVCNLDAENATSQIMRDVAEARKAGLGPEKCVVKATRQN